MATPLAVRAFEHHLLLYRRIWRATVVTGFVTPVLFLAAMGLGLGSLVGTQDDLGGIPYKDFVAAGLLCATAMQVAAVESTWPVLANLKWSRTYLAQTATPLRPDDAALGHQLYIALRIAISVAVYFVVMVAFGTVGSPWGVLAVPVALLCGVAHATPITAFSATRGTTGSAFSALQRFVLVPLFLFGGTFFPIDQLPAWIRPVAWVTPLWHGVELSRALTLGEAELLTGIGHVAVMVAWAVAGYVTAVVVYRRKLSV